VSRWRRGILGTIVTGAAVLLTLKIGLGATSATLGPGLDYLQDDLRLRKRPMLATVPLERYLLAERQRFQRIRTDRRRLQSQFRGGVSMAFDQTVFGCEDRRVARAMRLASQDLSKRPTVDEIANAVGLSRTHFSRRFHLLMGMSFAEWSTLVRINEAKELLKLIDLSITGVAAAVGYSDVTTFARVFRKYELMSPRDYRMTLLGSRTELGQGTPTMKSADSAVQSADLLVRNAETEQEAFLDTQ
jgi:AraC-like DNA-binding protein